MLWLEWKCSGSETVRSAELRKHDHEKKNWGETGERKDLPFPFSSPATFASSQPSESLEWAKDDYETNPASGQNGARPGTVRLKVWSAINHSTMLPPYSRE